MGSYVNTNEVPYRYGGVGESFPAAGLLPPPPTTFPSNEPVPQGGAWVNTNEAPYMYVGVGESAPALLPPPLSSRYSSEILTGRTSDGGPWANHQDGVLRNFDNASSIASGVLHTRPGSLLGSPPVDNGAYRNMPGSLLGSPPVDNGSYHNMPYRTSPPDYRADSTEGYVPQFVVPRASHEYRPEGEIYPARRIDRESSPPRTRLRMSWQPSPPPESLPLPGMIFGCTTETYQECIRLQLFGLPSSNIAMVRRVVPGSKLFLYNFREKELSGIFEATSCGDTDLVPTAFRRWGSYPAQVRVRLLQKCPNLPISVFKVAIIDNFYDKWKFRYGLNEAQVRDLIELFRLEAENWDREEQQLRRQQEMHSMHTTHRTSSLLNINTK